MRGWVMSRNLIAVAVLAALPALQACHPRVAPLSDEFKESMADWSAGKAVDDALRRQIQAPDQSDSMRGSHHALTPGEPPQVVAQLDAQPVDGLPATQWQPGAILAARYTLPLPPEAQGTDLRYYFVLAGEKIAGLENVP